MKENKYRLGLVSVSFRQHSPIEILEATKKAGLSCIEWGSDVHAPCQDIERLREIAALQKEYGVFCSSYGTYFRLGETPIGDLEKYISAAKILGTDILRLWCGTKSGDEYSTKEKHELIEQCKQAAEIACRENVTLCMECHKGTYTQKLEYASELMSSVNSPHFRMYWQPFQWQSVEENLTYAQAIAGYARHIHVFQWKDKERFSLNDGVEEWRAYLSKFTTPRTLLLEFMPDDKITSLLAEVNALKSIIGEKE